jgi:hypothetical protein
MDGGMDRREEGGGRREEGGGRREEGKELGLELGRRRGQRRTGDDRRNLSRFNDTRSFC